MEKRKQELYQNKYWVWENDKGGRNWKMKEKGGRYYNKMVVFYWLVNFYLFLC